jgi:hypothetical protein
VVFLKNVGIWSRNRRVFEAVQEAAAALDLSASLLAGTHPADFTGGALDLLCIAPGAAGWAGAPAIQCRMLLLPGGLGPLARGLRPACAVSYGTSPKDTLTLSSLEGAQICLALQRELVTLDGSLVEEQEWVLPFPVGYDAMDYLAAAGVLLALGGGEAVTALG